MVCFLLLFQEKKKKKNILEGNESDYKKQFAFWSLYKRQCKIVIHLLL